jgi:15-cis-phytoene synthase
MINQFQWEGTLLALARKALEHDRSDERPVQTNHLQLQVAYQNCQAITKANSKTFYMASSLLPPSKRWAVQALYAFCRLTDDIVDRGHSDSGLRLEQWEKQILQPSSFLSSHSTSFESLVALAWHDARKRYSVPSLYVEQLVRGVASDLRKNRYATFNELVSYCYGVACTVGLMSMHIVGHDGPQAMPYAIRLGVALQLTNILRDVGEDWRMGRLYLPKEELDAFGLTESDIESGLVTEKWRKFMRFQVERVRIIYASAMPGIAMLHPDGRFAIAAAAELYQAILVEIEKSDYDVFSRRAVVSKWDKLRRLPGIWDRARKAQYPEIHIPSVVLAGGIRLINQ